MTSVILLFAVQKLTLWDGDKIKILPRGFVANLCIKGSTCIYKNSTPAPPNSKNIEGFSTSDQFTVRKD